MQVINGRWVDDNQEPLEFHEAGAKIKALGERVTSVFGNDITYERINIIQILSQKNNVKEKVIDTVLNNKELFNKLTGY
jgi:hypothetical protein